MNTSYKFNEGSKSNELIICSPKQYRKEIKRAHRYMTGRRMATVMMPRSNGRSTYIMDVLSPEKMNLKSKQVDFRMFCNFPVHPIDKKMDKFFCKYALKMVDNDPRLLSAVFTNAYAAQFIDMNGQYQEFFVKRDTLIRHIKDEFSSYFGLISLFQEIKESNNILAAHKPKFYSGQDTSKVLEVETKELQEEGATYLSSILNLDERQYKILERLSREKAIDEIINELSFSSISDYNEEVFNLEKETLFPIFEEKVSAYQAAKYLDRMGVLDTAN